MTLPLENKTVAITEHRYGPEFGELIKRHGARVLACPLLEERPVDDRGKVQEFILAVIGGGVDTVVFFTGVGARFLIEEADAMGEKARFLAAVNGARVVVRGPKPAVVLRREGIGPDVIPTTPTSAVVLNALRSGDLGSRSIGVQLYADQSGDFCSELERAGARVLPVEVYTYGEVSDRAAVGRLIDSLLDGSIDVITFTSAPQAKMLFSAASESGHLEALQTTLRDHVTVAAVGGVTEQALGEFGVRAAIRPDVPKMGPMAQAIAGHFARDSV